MCCSVATSPFSSMNILLYFDGKRSGTEMVQVTPLRRTLASSSQSEYASCLQCFDTQVKSSLIINFAAKVAE